MVKVRVFDGTGKELRPSEFKYTTFFDDNGELQTNQSNMKIIYEIIQKDEDSILTMSIK